MLKLMFRAAWVTFVVTLAVGLWTGSTNSALGTVNGLSLVAGLVLSVVLVVRHRRRVATNAQQQGRRPAR